MTKDAAESRIPAERIAQYDQLIAVQPGVERKGAKLPYTSLNGNTSSYLGPDGSLALRLGPEDRRTFMERYERASRRPTASPRRSTSSCPTRCSRTRPSSARGSGRVTPTCRGSSRNRRRGGKTDHVQVPAEAREAIFDWYGQHARPLAFRRTADRRVTLVSDMIAQQMGASRAADHWEAFMARFTIAEARAGDCSIDSIVCLQSLSSDIDNDGDLDGWWRRQFPDFSTAPPRFTFQAGALPAGAKIEIQAIAGCGS